MSSPKCEPECTVCTEKYNRSNRKTVICPYSDCQYAACRDCVKKYVIGSFNEPACLNCRKTFTRKFLVESLEKVWMRETYRTHRENVLFEKERAFMASTQPYVESAKRGDEMMPAIAAKNAELAAMQDEITAIVRRRNKIATEIAELQAERARLQNPTGASVAGERRQFVRKCTAPECRGFLSTQWKCGICDMWTCPECYEVRGLHRDDPHECDPDTLASAKLIASDTKTCPKCATGIYKLEGCSVMFCTECHTAFDWRTNAIITNNIHNPHYFEWRTRMGTNDRNPDEVICGRDMNHEFITQISLFAKRLFRRRVCGDLTFRRSIWNAQRVPWSDHLNTLCREILAIQMTLPNYANNQVTDNLDMRILYLRNRVTEPEFKHTVQKREKVAERRRELGNVYGMLVRCSIDVVYRFYADLRAEGVSAAVDNAAIEGTILAFFVEMETLRAYTNECFRDIAATYSVVARVISPDFNDTSETQLATLKRDRLTDITRALSQEFAAAGRAIDTPEATAEIAATARARLAAEEA